MITNSTWNLILQVVCSLLAAAALVLAATWRKSPVYLPLPSGPSRRWLRVVPILATVAIIGILSTWFTDCSYLRLLTALIVGAFLLCVALMLVHHKLLQRIEEPSTLLIVICLGWSILGALSASSTAALVIAKQKMDDAYEKRPLKLWHVVGGHNRKPEDAIYLTAGLPAHFKGDMDDCHDRSPEMSLFPKIGQLAYGTYYAPDVIRKEQQVNITAKSKNYGTESATIFLCLIYPI